MASSWGDSWGTSWLDSWGTAAAPSTAEMGAHIAGTSAVSAVIQGIGTIQLAARINGTGTMTGAFSQFLDLPLNWYGLGRHQPSVNPGQWRVKYLGGRAA